MSHPLQELLDNDRRPDVVMMEMVLKGLSGEELVRQLKKIDKDVNVVVFTSSLSMKMKKRMVNLGVREYISKPITTIKLIKILFHKTKTIEK